MCQQYSDQQLATTVENSISNQQFSICLGMKDHSFNIAFCLKYVKVVDQSVHIV